MAENDVEIPVDLTENHILGVKNKSSELKTILNMFEFKFLPWDFDKMPRKFDEFAGSDNPLIATGNYQERQAIQEVRDYYNNKVCDRCGKKLSVIPIKDIGLCKSCRKELDREFGSNSIWWLKKENKNDNDSTKDMLLNW